MGTIRYAAPICDLLITAKGGYITQLYFDGGITTPPTLCVTEPNKEDAQVLSKVAAELDNYYAGELKTFLTPIAPTGTPFRMAVWKALQTIPYGETISYKELALRIGNPAAIRAVGGANHNNPISIIIPCHRVIGASGKLVGYGGGVKVKQYLLELEDLF